jgi:hypothetical protein
MESLNEAVGANKKHRNSKNKKDNDKNSRNGGSNKENNPKVHSSSQAFSFYIFFLSIGFCFCFW